MVWPTGDQGGPHELHITPADNANPEDVAGGISSVLLRRINFQAAIRERQPTSETEKEAIGGILRKLLAAGISDTYLAMLANTYVRYVHRGQPALTDTLARMIGKRPDTVKQHLKRARQAGMLTTASGKAGGNTTQKADHIIRQQADAGNLSTS